MLRVMAAPRKNSAAVQKKQRREHRREIRRKRGSVPNAGIIDPLTELAESKITEDDRRKIAQARAAHARSVRASRFASREGLIGLTTLQRNFVIEYGFDYNPRRAYLRAGGSASNLSGGVSAMLGNERVRDRIDEIDKQRRDNLAVTGDRITQELSKMAFFNLEDISDIDTRGRLVIDFNKATVDQLACIQEISHTQHGGQRVKFTDKKAALELLGKIRTIKLFSDITEHTNPDGTPLQPPPVIVQFGVRSPAQLAPAPAQLPEPSK